MSVNRNHSIDLFRYIFAIMVVAIHTALFSDVNAELYFYVVGIICRLAVPFFAICTGYFLKKQLKNSVFNAPVSCLPFVKQWKKLFHLYLFWSIIYLFFSIPMWIKIDWFSMWAFIDYGIGTLTKGSHYHLWFILSMLYAVPVMYVTVAKSNHKFQIAAAVVLYSVKAVIYGYRPFLPDTINKIFSVMDKFSGFTDAVFCILPFMLIGYCMDNCKEISKRKAFLLFLGYLTLWIAEAKLAKVFGVVSYSYLFFLFPASYYLFALIRDLKISNKNIAEYKLNELSLYVYCIHPIFIETLSQIQLPTLILFVVVSVLSTAIGLAMIKIKNKTKSSNEVKICSN